MHQSPQERCKFVSRIGPTRPTFNVCGPDSDQNRRIASGDNGASRDFGAPFVSCLEIEQRLDIRSEGAFDPRCHLTRECGLAIEEVGQGRSPDSKQTGGLGYRHVLRNDVLSDVCAGVNRLFCCSRHGHASTIAKLYQGAVLTLP